MRMSCLSDYENFGATSPSSFMPTKSTGWFVSEWDIGFSGLQSLLKIIGFSPFCRTVGLRFKARLVVPRASRIVCGADSTNAANDNNSCCCSLSSSACCCSYCYRLLLLLQLLSLLLMLLPLLLLLLLLLLLPRPLLLLLRMLARTNHSTSACSEHTGDK